MIFMNFEGEITAPIRTTKMNRMPTLMCNFVCKRLKRNVIEKF